MEKRSEEKTVTVSRSAWFTLAILSSTLLTVFFSETMLLPAIPEIMVDFDIPFGTAAWIFSGYMIVAAVMTPIAGKMSDVYGKKKILLILLAIYIGGTIIGGLANNISILLVSRLLQGVGLAAVPAAFSLVRESFPPEKIAIAIGTFGSAYSAGSVVGLMAGASIIQNFGWNATFFFIAPVAALVTFLIARFVKEAKIQQPEEGTELSPRRPSIDLKGAFALSATIIAFLIGLTLVQVGITPENIPQIATAFTLSIISLAVFTFIERRVIGPLVDFRLLKNKTLLPSYIILMATGVTMFLAYPAIVQLVRSPEPLGFGGTAVDAANVQLPFMIMFLVFAASMPYIVSKIGNIRPIILGSLITLAGSISLLMFHATEMEVAVNLGVIAAGLSIANLAAWNVVITKSPLQFIGISTGVGALLLFIGMSIGPTLSGVYMAEHDTILGIEGSFPTPGSYDLVFLTSGVLSAICLAFSLILYKNRARNK